MEEFSAACYAEAVVRDGIEVFEEPTPERVGRLKMRSSGQELGEKGQREIVAGDYQESCVRGRLTIMPGRTCLRT